MAHKAKSETLIQTLARFYRLDNSTGAITKKLKRITKELYGESIAANKLTDRQRQDVEEFALRDVMEQDKKESAACRSNVEPSEMVAEQTPCLPQAAQVPTQTDSTHTAEQIPTNSRATPANSMLKGVETMRFTLRLTDGKGGRKDVFLEKPFSDALNVIIPDELARKDWLITRVKSASEQNPASAVRCAIVLELLSRLAVAPLESKGKNT